MAKEVLFSRKKLKVIHPNLTFIIVVLFKNILVKNIIIVMSFMTNLAIRSS